MQNFVLLCKRKINNNKPRKIENETDTNQAYQHSSVEKKLNYTTNSHKLS